LGSVNGIGRVIGLSDWFRNGIGLGTAISDLNRTENGHYNFGAGFGAGVFIYFRWKTDVAVRCSIRSPQNKRAVGK